jgi:hypothetical protein
MGCFHPPGRSERVVGQLSNLQLVICAKSGCTPPKAVTSQMALPITSRVSSPIHATYSLTSLFLVPEVGKQQAISAQVCGLNRLLLAAGCLFQELVEMR